MVIFAGSMPAVAADSADVVADTSTQVEDPSVQAGATEPSAEPAAQSSTADAATVPAEKTTTAPPLKGTFGMTTASLAAVDPTADQARLIVTKGGNRTSVSDVSGLEGATFQFYKVGSATTLTGGTLAGTCTTDSDGECDAFVTLAGTAANYFYAMETAAPSGWAIPASWGASSDLVRYNSGAISKSDTNRTVHLPGVGRAWPDVHQNNTVTPKCGLNTAIVFDLSGSVTAADLAQYKSAANSFIDSLAGTPSRVALFTFASTAPASGAANTSLPLTSVASAAGVTTVKNKINGFTKPGSAAYYTNWDRGLWQVANSGTAYDAVLFITDGDPTRYGDDIGTGSGTNLRYVEEAIHSGNAVKATGAQLMAVGVGVTAAASIQRLKLISGPNDAYTTNFGQLGSKLTVLGAGACAGVVTVQKQIQDYQGNAVAPNPADANGWNFSGSISAGTIGSFAPTASQNGTNGFTNTQVSIGGGATPTITLTEALTGGFTFVDATCTVDGNDATVTKDPVVHGRISFQGAANVPVNCTFVNKRPTPPGSLTLVERVLDPAGNVAPGLGGNWTLKATGATRTFSGAGNSAAVTTQPVTGGTPYTLSESGGLAGYESSAAWQCVLNSGGGTLALAGPDKVTPQPAQNITCTITNQRKLADLTVSKTATPSFDRDYDWTIAKTVDRKTANIAAGSTAPFAYTVTATPTAAQNANFKVAGKITVTNPNDVAISAVDVTDTIGSTNCSVVGGTSASIPASGTKVLDYSCSMPAGTTPTTAGTNTANATWTAANYYGTTGTATGTKNFDFAAVTPTTTDATATITDNQFDLGALPGSNVVTATNGVATFAYSKSLPGTAGTCTDYPNTATLSQDDGALRTASETVKVCVGTNLIVSKNVTSGFNRSYAWTIGKSSDRATKNVDPTTGKATFDYSVKVTAGKYTDSNWGMSGTITVRNPNDWEDITADVTDTVNVGGGAQCAVAGGTTLVIPKGGQPVVLNYSCTFTGQPAYDGVNTGKATWDGAAASTPAGSATGTAAITAATWSQAPANKTVTVVDDKTDPSHPVTLGTATWVAEGQVFEFTYSLGLDGAKGKCLPYSNVATLSTGQSATNDVSVCWPRDVTVSKTAHAAFDRTYDWTIAKDVDKTKATVDEATGSAKFDYTVNATPAGYVDSEKKLVGNITVHNPNDYKSVTVDVADTIDIDGVTCALTGSGLGVVVAASSDATLPYVCDVGAAAEADYTGATNTATATWPGGSATGTAAVTFNLDKKINDTITVDDDMASPTTLGTASWNAGGQPKVFTYSVTHTGTPGRCTDFVNTAVIEATAQEARKSVTVCVQKALTVSKTAAASFDRTYEWSIDKGVDTARQTIDEGGQADFQYGVSATPRGFRDSGQELSGRITVTNPNAFADVVVDIADVVDIGGVTCAVTGGDNVTVPKGGHATVDYTCAADGVSATDYTGGQNMATATWTGPSGQQSASGTTAVTFVLDKETDKTVHVTDDKTDPDADPVGLGTATWNTAGDPTVFDTYKVVKTGVAGTCTDYANTATITETDQVAKAKATLCVTAAVEVAKTADASYDRTYLWTVDKTVDENNVEIHKDGSATFDYTVKANPNGSSDSNWSMTGDIEVANPNDFTPLTVDVSDAPDVGGGAVCVVEGGNGADIAAGATRTFGYSCDFTSKPAYTGKNVATVAVGDKSVTADASVGFVLDKETDKSVKVYDDKVTHTQTPVLLGEADWNTASTATSFTYSLDQTGKDGECRNYTNTAFAEVAGTDPEDSVTVGLCVEDDLTIAKTAAASFDRDYHWGIDKSVDKTRADISQGQSAAFDYTVTAKPAGYTDSNWAMDGTFTVLNPNKYKSVTVDISDAPNVGGGAVCGLADGQDLTVASGATRQYGYTCTFDEKPDYDGTNTAGLSWNGPDGKHQVTASAAVTFELAGQTHKTTKVFDDKVTHGDDPELLGTADWAEGNKDFTYTLSQTGTPGTCTNYTNTAHLEPQGEGLIAGLGSQQDSKTVSVCVQAGLKLASTAGAAFDRSYDWSIDKAVDKTTATVDVVGHATFNYTVTATPGDYTDSNWSMAGTIDVTNPNTYAGGTIIAKVVDVPGVGEGAECTVIDGDAVTIAPGETKKLAYTCGFATKPAYAGSAEATATWTGPGSDARTASAAADVAFDMGTETDKKIQVVDDMTDPLSVPVMLGEQTWTEDRTPVSYTYSIKKAAVAGVCTNYTNTASYAEVKPIAELATILGAVPLAGAAVVGVGGESVSTDITVCGDLVNPPIDPVPDDDTDPPADPPADKPIDKPADKPIDKPIDKSTDASLPSTGAPEHTLGLLGLGLGGLLIGAWFMVIDRRRKRPTTQGGPPLKP